MQTVLASAHEVAKGASAQMRGSEASGAPNAPGTHDQGEYRYSMLQTRCARLEQNLRTTQGVLAVLKSKQPRPAEREAFLLGELEKMSKDLLCKRL